MCRLLTASYARASECVDRQTPRSSGMAFLTHAFRYVLATVVSSWIIIQLQFSKNSINRHFSYSCDDFNRSEQFFNRKLNLLLFFSTQTLLKQICISYFVSVPVLLTAIFFLNTVFRFFIDFLQHLNSHSNMGINYNNIITHGIPIQYYAPCSLFWCLCTVLHKSLTFGQQRNNKKKNGRERKKFVTVQYMGV